jgi:hypothetical protein
MQKQCTQKNHLVFLLLIVFGAVILGLLSSVEIARADSYEHIRTYSSDDGRSQINIQTRSSSNSDSSIRSTIRAYSSSASDTTNSSQGSSMFATTLSGSQEVPTVSTVTTGRAAFEVADNGDSIEYTVDVWNGEDITAAHLHCAPKGANGAVAVSLFSSGDGIDVNGELESGEITNNDVTNNCSGIDDLGDLVEEIEDGDIYVNVHSTSHPDGLIRGQLHGSSDDDDNDDNNIPSRKLIERIEELLEIIRNIIGNR